MKTPNTICPVCENKPCTCSPSSEGKEDFIIQMKRWGFVPVYKNEVCVGFNLPDDNLKEQIGRPVEFVDVPMGVSQWMNHGKKYGYWTYFRSSVLDECVKAVEGTGGWTCVDHGKDCCGPLRKDEAIEVIKKLK